MPRYAPTRSPDALRWGQPGLSARPDAGPTESFLLSLPEAHSVTRAPSADRDRALAARGIAWADSRWIPGEALALQQPYLLEQSARLRAQLALRLLILAHSPLP